AGCTICACAGAGTPITAAPSPAAPIAANPIRRSHRILHRAIAIPLLRVRAMANALARTCNYTPSLPIGFLPTRPPPTTELLCTRDVQAVAVGDLHWRLDRRHQSLYDGSRRSASRRQAAQSLPPFRKLPSLTNWPWAYSQASRLGIV